MKMRYYTVEAIEDNDDGSRTIYGRFNDNGEPFVQTYQADEKVTRLKRKDEGVPNA